MSLDTKITTANCHIGTWVWYWPVRAKTYSPRLTRIISTPWQLGHGAWVCKCDGESGGIQLDFLSKAVDYQLFKSAALKQVKCLLDDWKDNIKNIELVKDGFTDSIESSLPIFIKNEMEVPNE